MCFFNSKPQAPTIIYQGPSQSDIDSSRAILEEYRKNSLIQQETFSTGLQKQIDAANAITEKQRTALLESKTNAETGLASKKAEAEAELLGQKQKANLEMAAQKAGANAEMAAQQQVAYGVATTSTAEPSDAVTTTAAKPKEKTKAGLKITPGATAASAGTGLNIGF